MKTLRGLNGRAHAGLCTGLLPYGYRSEPDPASGGKRILVDEERAAVVRRIFRECAEGRTLSGIARRLTQDLVTPPRGNGLRTRDDWVLNGVRSILLNPKHIGTWSYNRREFRKAPGENRRLPRPKSALDVITKERPDLRIVSDEVWAAVQERFAENRARYGAEKRKAKARSKGPSFGRAGRPTHYLLSGLLVCGACGAPMTIHGSGEGRAYYRYDDAVKRGTCSNRLSVREVVAREVLLAGIRDTLASSDAVAYARRRIAEKLGELARSGDGTTKQLRKRLAESERRLENLTNAIADGAAPAVLLGKLRAEEEAAKALRAELALAEAASAAPVHLPSPEELLRAVFDLDRLLRDDVEAGREALRRLLRGGTIRLVPGEDRVYTAHAEVLPFGLALGTPETTTPAAGDLGGRVFDNLGCGDLLGRAYRPENPGIGGGPGGPASDTHAHTGELISALAFGCWSCSAKFSLERR